MNNRWVFSFIAGCTLATAHAGELVDATTAIVDLCNTSQWCKVINVDDTGFDKEVFTNGLFKTCASVISNNWQSITNEWPLIRDDSEKRIIFRNTIGFAGTNAFYGIMGFVVEDAATNAVSKEVIIDSLMAPRSPLWMFTADHYDLTIVSNLLERIITVFAGALEEQAHYRSVLSGEYKRYLDDARSEGAIEF